MKRFFQAYINAFKIPEIRERLLITLAALAVFRFGSHIPIPGVDLEALGKMLQGTNFLGLLDVFSGGAFRRMTVFALGIMPYITAAILFQLLAAAIPSLERLTREEGGRRKINRYTRITTVFIAAAEALFIASMLNSPRFGMTYGEIVADPNPVRFYITAVILMTAGTMFLLWLGEKVTDRGIGNGISLLISWGIISRIPSGIRNIISLARRGGISFVNLLGFVVVAVVVIAAIILMDQAQRRIPVQYARRVVGRRVYGGTSTYIPLRLNTAGVMPIIFAMAVMYIPTFLSSSLKVASGSATLDYIASILRYGSPLWVTLYFLLIIFFTYFYTAVVLNPEQIARDLQKYGGFIPGRRPGKPTVEYLESVLNKITLLGAFFLGFIAILPLIVRGGLSMPIYFGGTGILIVVGVELDTLRQLESHLLMRRYDGFLEKGRIRGRF